MHAGHVGISFDGGKTIYGLTPDWEGKMTIEEAGKRLKNHEVFPGIVKDDTKAFKDAERMAGHGWNTELERAIVVFDRVTQPETYEQVQRWKAGESPIGYSFPLPKPVDGQHFKGGTDYNGKTYCPDDVSNCAVWPSKLNIPIPEPSGNMIKYMPALKRWAEADAPIDARPKESAE